MKSYIVIGLGRFGGSLARQLCTLGAEVLAMDVHNDLVQQLGQRRHPRGGGATPGTRKSCGRWACGILTARSLPSATILRPPC